MEGVDLVAQLAIILIAAGVFTVISKALKQPLILGYIIAGFIVGPNLGLFPQMGSQEAIKQWSDIGIIFLLFALGLEFSFKKLLKVGSSALITAGTICIGMFIVGSFIGSLLGWTQMESIFLGGLMSMSSTTIIIKAYNDMGLKNTPHATLIFGTLVIEDLIAVLLMVLLSTLAVSNKFDGGEMFWSLVKLAFYILVWFLFGIYLIPTLLKKAKPYLSDEILLLISIGLCFGMVTLAEAAGFSSALGAFVMGSILSETMEGERIGKLMGGIKDLFGAIFFVSVGMMVNPVIIGQNWLTILIITLAAMSGITILGTAGPLIAGKGLNIAVHTGFTMAQLGEFGFIIASLGCSLGVMREFIYPVIIAVSVITTFTTPYMIKAADPVCAWLFRVLPEKTLIRLQPVAENRKRSAAEENIWAKYLKYAGFRSLIYVVVLVAIGLIADAFLPKILDLVLPSSATFVKELLTLAITMMLLAPFIYAMAVPNTKMRQMSEELLSRKAAFRWPLLGIVIMRNMICIAFILINVMGSISSRPLALGISLLLIAVFITLLLSKKHSPFEVEEVFFGNLNAKEVMEREDKPVTAYIKETLQGYDIHIESFVVPQEFSSAGKTLKEIPFCKSSGVNIVRIRRGNIDISVPAGDEMILPGDELSVVGTTDQISSFRQIMNENISSGISSNEEKLYVDTISVKEGSALCGKMLKDLNMRASHCMVISVMRNGVLTTNPKADFIFGEGDTVWIAGEEESCKWYE